MPVSVEATPAPSLVTTRDLHSHSNPDKVRVRHVALDLEVLFDQRTLKGSVTLSLDRVAPDASVLVLDTRSLDVEKVEASPDGRTFAPTEFVLKPADKILGAPLEISLPKVATQVRITYATRPEASALQWLGPLQTATREDPYLFTQSQAIHARSWIPLQDTPAVRQTYAATIRTPKNLVAVMSAVNEPNAARDGEFRFDMPQKIPSYLFALAVGDIVFAPLGPRAGVYAERPVLQKAAAEFSDTEKMIEAAERLFGPYRWERYDLLVLPPSFPFGGMENPRLTFATPTLLAGDKSLVDVVAHELAHSWSGNLVTNATWSDFWLNEGFTTYCERRIVEEVYGRERAAMEWVLGRQKLDEEIARLPEQDEILHIDLAGRDPDEGLTDVAYEKGALFLRTLEEHFGRERLDRFLKGYFDRFAFQSITTGDFEAYLKKELLGTDAGLATKIPVEEWLTRPGVPAGAPELSSEAFVRVEAEAQEWLAGKVSAESIDAGAWSTLEWLHFLRKLPAPLPKDRMAQLDRRFRLTRSGNSEITFQWLLMAIKAGYEPAFARLEEFLSSMGRRKFLKPLYEELGKTPPGRRRALAIYRKARSGYHPIAVEAVDKIVQWKP